VTFSLAPELAAIVRPGVLWIDDATVVEGDARLDTPLEAAEAAIREIFRLEPEATRGALSAVEGQAEAVRTMYKRVGLDPTKRRPSSEALLRRVRKGEPLPRINSMVDVCNWCSLEFQLPYGLYDTAHVKGDVVLRLGFEGESYPGIRKDEVHVGGRITLADAIGPFGNPTSDSARTMVTPQTTNALLVVFAPVEIDTARLTRVLDRTAARMREFTGGTPRAISTVEVTHERRRAQGQN
jgi:DNA/RNA-binding domain of Phe-tRNA-synthetase-like protein